MLASTMNAVICLTVFPFDEILSGVLAITTNSSARVPFVHHSFSPLMMKFSPSSVGVAVVRRFAGSEPASARARFGAARSARHDVGSKRRQAAREAWDSASGYAAL